MAVTAQNEFFERAARDSELLVKKFFVAIEWCQKFNSSADMLIAERCRRFTQIVIVQIQNRERSNRVIFAGSACSFESLPLISTNSPRRRGELFSSPVLRFRTSRVPSPSRLVADHGLHCLKPAVSALFIRPLLNCTVWA